MKKTVKPFYLLGVLFAVLMAGRTTLHAAPEMVPVSFADVAEQAGPAVVNISTVRIVQSPFSTPQNMFGDPSMQEFFEHFFGPQVYRNAPPQKSTSLGSGVIVAQEGYVLTNNHVVEKADEILVKLKDGKEYKAKLVGSDASTDLAVLKLSGRKKWPSVEMGDSDKVRVGDWVIAMGSPFGLEQTVTSGIISAKGRTIGRGPYDEFIQTDASINPGNSGGPLIDMSGNVIGINTMIVSRSGGSLGIGFAIPVNMAKRIYNDIRNTGAAQRGWLGIYIQELTPQLARQFKVGKIQGVLLSAVVENGPADRAGMRPKDIIVSFNGRKVATPNELQRLVAKTRKKEKIWVTVLRSGSRKRLKIKIGDQANTAGKLKAGSRQAAKPPKQEKDVLGFRGRDVTKDDAKQLRTKNLEGVLVTSVKAGSPAEGAGIQAGDIIREINQQVVKNRQMLEQAYGKLKPGDELLIKIERQDYPIYMVMKIPEK
ncbi:DegQ family serine endoprotease [bacterium]|nr:DegQ family serine endoprotease [bacterium]